MNMKKIVSLLLLIVLILGTTNVNAVSLSEEYLDEIGVANAYVCGDYMFDIGGTFKPKLHDFMRAARSLPGTQQTNPATLYRITYLPALHSADIVEIFSGAAVPSTSLNLLQPIYLYRNHIKDSSPINLQ